jgi:hypothetical protein
MLRRYLVFRHVFPRVAMLAITVALAAAGTANATVISYTINANGIKEVSAAGVPGQGDLDGTAVGTVTLNDVAGSAIINLTLANLSYPLTGFHIHQAPATTTGAIVLNFGNPENFRTGNTIAATILGLSTTTIDAVFANPSGFYFNVHNTIFPGGAVRDQLATPEPGSLGLAISGLLVAAGLARHRSRKVSAH